MLNAVSSQLRIFFCTESTDMRKSFNTLCAVVRKSLMLDPLTGHLFVFRNHRGDKLKVLYWDSDGFAIWYKQLQRGTFQFPDIKNITTSGVEIDHSTLRMILDGIDLSTIKRKERFKISVA